MEKVKLGQLTNIKTGRLDVNAENPNGKYPFFTCSKNHTYIDDYAFDGESILVAGNGDLNVKYYNGKFNAYQRTYVIQANENLNGKFLFYFLDTYVEKLREQSIGGVIKYIKLGNLTDAEIPLPPLTTQQKIATILDQANDIIQNNRAIVQKYDVLTQSLFLDMFGGLKDNIKSLAEVCDINPKKSEISSLDKDLKVSFLQMSNVSEKGELILNDNRPILNVWSGFTYFRENDVLFAKITPCMENGKGGIARLLTNGIGFGSTEFHVLRPITNLTNSEWIYYLTMNKKFRALAEKNMTGSAGQKRVPKDFFSNYKLPIPSFSLQTKFAERVAVIEAQKQQAQLELAKSEELFQSLLQQAFKGELS